MDQRCVKFSHSKFAIESQCAEIAQESYRDTIRGAATRNNRIEESCPCMVFTH